MTTVALERAGVLRHREFRLLAGGVTISSLGNGITPVALAFAVLDLGGSAAELGLVEAAFSGAEVVTTLLGGVLGDRVYCYFDWDSSRRRGLIEALQTGNGRLIGRYVNITDPRIVRPWVGLIVSPQRIDGRWSGGRLDFRR